MKSFFSTVWLIFAKDIRLELRSKESFFSILVFCLSVLVILHFAINPQSGKEIQLLPALYWITLIFGGLLRLSRTFENEKVDKAWNLMLIIPLDRSALYLGKLLGNVFIFIVLELFLIPLFLIFFQIDIDFSLMDLFLVITSGMIGLAVLGTTIAALSMNLKMRDLMLPVLLLPLLLPVLIGSVEATSAVIHSQDIFKWLKIVLSFDIIYLGVSLLLFEYTLV